MAASNCKLRLVQFCEAGGGRRRVGVEQGNGGSVVDVTAVDPSIPSDMKSFIEAWDTSTAAATKSVYSRICTFNMLQLTQTPVHEWIQL